MSLSKLLGLTAALTLASGQNVPTYTNAAVPTGTALDGDYTGQYRPQVHFSPPKNWLNDPNGLFRDLKGTWHLYYQHDPANVDGGNPHWGHATSSDLYHWQNQPIAIFPPREGTSIYSGSAVIDVNNTSGFFPDQDDGVVAIYTLDSDIQVQEIAFSRDGGQTFESYEGNPVIPSTLADFRDPKVIWYEDHWAMVVSYAAAQTIGVFTSPDLKSWTASSNFTSPDGSNYECPNLVKMPIRDGAGGSVVGSKYVLTVGVGGGSPLGGSSTQYFVGDFDGETFTPDDVDIRYLDWTKDNYAGQSYYGLPEDEDSVFIGWAANLEYVHSPPTAEEGWRGAMTLPRSMHLAQSPAGDVSVVSAPYDLGPVTGDSLGRKQLLPNDELAVDFAAAASGAVSLSLEIENLDASSTDSAVNITFSSPATGEQLRAGYRFDGAGTLFVDRGALQGDDQSPLSPDEFSLTLDQSKTSWSLRMVVDRSVADIFGGDGAHPGTVLFYPKEPLTQLKVETFDTPEDAQIQVEVWALDSVWTT